MREKSEITHHCGQVPSGPGRSAGVSSGTNVGEFSLAHMVALQYTIVFSIFSGDRILRFRSFATSTASPRKTIHTFHYRRASTMKGFALATALRRDHICKVCLDRQCMAPVA